MSKIYVLIKKHRFFRDEARGYTENVTEAGLFTVEQVSRYDEDDEVDFYLLTDYLTRSEVNDKIARLQTLRDAVMLIEDGEL